MKLDFSGLESSAPLYGGSNDLLFDGFSAAPAFDLPVTSNFDEYQKKSVQMVKPAKGTTTLAFIFKDGVMVAADSRASMGGYISSQSVKKIIEINPYMLGTMAGGAADCQFWHRNLGIKCRLHELANKRRISVTGASKLLANILYSYRGMGLSVGTMIAGWDEKGPGLYYVDSEGGRLKGTKFSVGSGSPYAYGVLDSGYRYDMTVDEAAELARRSIYHATFRDGASGGVASVYHVGPNGWTKLSGDDVGELHYSYYPVEPATVEQEMTEAVGPGLYYVDSEGGRLKGTKFSVGSGSPYAYGVLDSGYRYDMTVDEAAELARRSIYHATFRDGASGGVASVYHVGPNGWTKLSGDDVGELHYSYYPVEPATVEQEMTEAVVA
ncbi:nucleophile aminohydrolase (Ntn hydrolases) superfamily protein [Artemisia annua]|uniref:proteasome endopeptidase complex n=1 Tax=Artemisia annua TaxID=35608 RepID=A0A2U1KYC5_ARTAN|nr:nucleophile aminohydrolase (Ntn hydrolases) superfamily protein [Artemisia annua]